MDITLPRNDLKEALTWLSRVIDKNPTIPILSAISIESSVAGLKISATNLNEYLTFNIKGKSDYQTPLIIDLPQLKAYVDFTRTADYYILNKISTGEIKLTTNLIEHPEKTFSAYKENLWPDKPIFPGTNNKPIPRESLKAIQSAIPSVATKETARASLKYLLLQTNAVVASNGLELVKIACETSIEERALIRPSKFISSSIFSERESMIGVHKFNNSRYLSISNNKWEYTTKLSEENYPEFKNIIPKDPAYTFTLSKDTAKRIQREIQLLEYTSPLKLVNLYLTENKLQIFPEEIKSKANSITLPVTAKGTSEPIVKTLKRTLLLRALSLGFNTFSFSKECSPILASNEINSFMLFMPVKTNEETIRQIQELNTKHNDQITPTKEITKMNTHAPEENTSNNYKPTFQGSELKTEPMEELINKIGTIRSKAREIIDISIDLSNQLRNIQKSTKAKEREFKVANELIDKLKKVSGF